MLASPSYTNITTRIMAARDVFDFFKLCGELRNAIYEQLLTTETFNHVNAKRLRIQAQRAI